MSGHFQRKAEEAEDEALRLEVLEVEHLELQAECTALRAKLSRAEAERDFNLEQATFFREHGERMIRAGTRWRLAAGEAIATAEGFMAALGQAEAERDALLEALDEVLNYGGGAGNALEDPYVMERVEGTFNAVLYRGDELMIRSASHQRDTSGVVSSENPETLHNGLTARWPDAQADAAEQAEEDGQS